MGIEEYVLDHHLYELTSIAVKECLIIVQQLINDKKYIGTYANYPSMKFFENGMPNFTSSFIGSDAPLQYDMVLASSELNLNEKPTFTAILDYAIKHDRLRQYYYLDRTEVFDTAKNWPLHGAKYLTDRYIHSHKTIEFEEKLFLSVYQEFERSIYLEHLPIQIIAPILFVKFDTEDSYSLAPEIRLEKMDELLQLSRMRHLVGYGYHEVHPLVAGAATHCLLLDSWTRPNENLLKSVSVTTPNILEYIDNFFGMMRIYRRMETGYAQVMMKAVGWNSEYTPTVLPTVDSTNVRAYPKTFDNGYWRNQDIPTVDNNDLLKIKEMLNKFQAIDNNRLKLATKRLNRCLIREDEEDSILDACMALETLLANEKTEIQHKLALRMSALTILSSGTKSSAKEMFSTIKRVYAYRSGVIHGNAKDVSKNREISSESGKKIPTVTIAIDCLRMALDVLIKHPGYLEPSKIDELILQKLV